jgi:hypothetical protein
VLLALPPSTNPSAMRFWEYVGLFQLSLLSTSSKLKWLKEHNKVLSADVIILTFIWAMRFIVSNNNKELLQEKLTPCLQSNGIVQKLLAIA